MRDYRQQTAGLRGAAKGLREIDMPKTAEQMDDAADAIEDLQARNDKQTMMIRKQSERTKELQAAVSKWISVEQEV